MLVMSNKSISIFTIAPYRFLPANNGGHHAIINLHHHLGEQCENTIVSTDDNGDNPYSFKVYPIFPDRPLRYFPGYGVNKMIDIAREHNATHIICEHPYMIISAMIVAERLDIPWYIHSHNIESERFRAFGKKWWPILRQYEKYAMNKCDGVFFITPEDTQWAIKNFNLPAAKCHDVPFGTNLTAPPKQNNLKEKVGNELELDSTKPWLYFLGALDYPPNEDAVSHILNDLYPLMNKHDIDAEIIIVGKGLSEDLQAQINSISCAHYLGYVPDLTELLTACDVMLNPVMSGGGIKTKAVEAIAYNNTVVSSQAGAAGLLRDVCKDKLLVSEDHNWEHFTQDIATAISHTINTSAEFYTTYNNKKIADKVLDILKSN